MLCINSFITFYIMFLCVFKYIFQLDEVWAASTRRNWLDYALPLLIWLSNNWYHLLCIQLWQNWKHQSKLCKKHWVWYSWKVYRLYHNPSIGIWEFGYFCLMLQIVVLITSFTLIWVFEKCGKCMGMFILLMDMCGYLQLFMGI